MGGCDTGPDDGCRRQPEGEGDHDRSGDGAAPWGRCRAGGGLVPGQVGQQLVKVAVGTRGERASEAVVELSLVEPAGLEVLAEFGRHGVPFGIGCPQVRVPGGPTESPYGLPSCGMSPFTRVPPRCLLNPFYPTRPEPAPEQGLPGSVPAGPAGSPVGAMGLTGVCGYRNDVAYANHTAISR